MIFIDKNAVLNARWINEVRDTADVRQYYLLANSKGKDATIVVRNGYTLQDLINQKVDAQVGWDIAQIGFANETQLGQPRTKITIRRPIQRPLARSQRISDVIEE